MDYSINELAKLAGISTRTLRYYDDINLLKPAKITHAGYRIYGEHEVDLLQQILFFKELGVPLEKISLIINNPKFNSLDALQEHLTKLKMKKQQLEKLIQNVEKTISHLKGEIEMSNKEKFEAFKNHLVDANEKQYGKEIREKYGDDTINASNQKFKNMPKEQFKEMQKIEQDIFALLKEAIENKDDYSSSLAKQIVALHTKWIKLTWPSYSKEAHLGLADIYVADERFTAYYDQVGNGATKYLRDAIHHFLQK